MFKKSIPPHPKKIFRIKGTFYTHTTLFLVPVETINFIQIKHIGSKNKITDRKSRKCCNFNPFGEIWQRENKYNSVKHL